jgi:hypothetical protein
MSRLRHPIEEIHDRWGKAGLIVALIALIAALGGTALAASGALTGKQKKEVTAIAKKFAGKNGANGANGTNGTNGAAGPTGKQGPQGLPGSNGTNGSNGNSILVGTAGAECGAAGGTTVEVQGEPSTKKAICNGEPGPVTEVLPAGLTMRGVFDYSNFVRNYRTGARGCNGLCESAYGTPQRLPMSVSFPFRVENSSGEGPLFHYIRYMGEEAETLSGSSALIIGPAAGTGNITVPAKGTGDVTSGSKQVTGLATTGGAFVVGQEITGKGIPSGTTIATLGTGTLELSANATETKSGDELTGLTNAVKVNVTSGEFVTGERTAGISIGTEVTGEGIPSGTIVTGIAPGAGSEVTLTLATQIAEGEFEPTEPTETKSGDELTGLASPVITFTPFSGGNQYPTPGELIAAPGVPVGATITRLIQGTEYPRQQQFEISALPTASANNNATFTLAEPHGCTGTYKHPGAEPGNFCLFLKNAGEESETENYLNEGEASEEVGYPAIPSRILEGLHAVGEFLSPAPVDPTGAEFHALAWFQLSEPQEASLFQPKWLHMSEAEKLQLKNEGDFEGTVRAHGRWAVTAP